MPDKARAEFQTLSEETVLSALDNPESQNPTAIEVGRLVASFTRLLQQEQPPITVDPQKVIAVQCPIEAVALRLAAKLAGLPVVKDGKPKEV
jgi:hypothetical protein